LTELLPTLRQYADAGDRNMNVATLPLDIFELAVKQLSEQDAMIADNIERLYELDRYRERYEQLREALIDALGPQGDTIISLCVGPAD
jgi:hypothetical protein